MYFHSVDHPQYFQSPHQVLSFEVDKDFTILETCRAILDELNGMELDDDIYADALGYVAWLMSENDINQDFIDCPDYEDPVEEIDELMQAYFVLGRPERHPAGSYEYAPLRGNIRVQWIDTSQDLPEAVCEDELVIIPDLPNWDAHHITNTMGVMVRPFTELGDMDQSYLIFWTS